MDEVISGMVSQTQPVHPIPKSCKVLRDAGIRDFFGRQTGRK